MKRLACLVTFIVAVAGCSGGSPLAPDEPAFATISGWVYADVTWADPPVPDARIEVYAADGTKAATLSDGTGFYQVAVRPGTVVITTRKEGYDAETYELSLSTDTTLNFFLSPV